MLQNSICPGNRGLMVVVAFLALSASCKHVQKKEPISTTKNEVVYTCSMHPQVKEEHPGKCPICQMELIAVPKTSMQTSTGVKLTEEQIRLGNIQVDTINNGNIGDRMVLTGTLNFNQQKLTSISTRISGRIDKLYVKQTGSYIHKGDKLYDLYSEELNNVKQEYVKALQEQATIGNSVINYHALVESAKNKLFLWGMGADQISQLEKNKESSILTSFYSSESGYVTAINIQEGGYAAEGTSIIQLADLSTLWAEAQVYTTQLATLDKSERVQVSIPDLNNLSIEGQIEFANPEINPDTRINLIRITIPNKNNQLRPGMPVYIIVNSKPHHSVTLPANAVLFDSKGATVWTQIKPGEYQIRMVQTGITSNNTVEIISGLKPGDIVVTSGAYLINSEYIFENGANPMAGMDMNNMKM